MIAAAGLAIGTVLAPAARAASEQENLVERARIAVDDLKTDKEFGNALDLLRRARGVVIVPSLIKGGFFIGGEGGEGVLLARSGEGWSNPAFYSLGSASFGLQIGLEQAEVIILIMNDKALSAIMRNEFKIGADAGLAVVTLGSGAEAATTSAVGADIVVWASATGAYAGITIKGSILSPDKNWNTAYYGRPIAVDDIIRKPHAVNPGAGRLRQELASIQ